MSIALPDAVQMLNLTARFYAELDDRNYDGVLSCMASDGVWVRRGAEVVGHEAIAAALRSRPENFHTRHLVTNLQVEQVDDTHGSVTFYMMGHPHIGEIPAGTYVPIPHPHILAVYRDTMVKRDGRWFIAEKRPLRTAYKDDLKLP